MTPRRAGPHHALARATATVLEESDVGDVLAGLVAACAELLGAGAVAILAREDDVLDLLSATSHRATELEMLQIQRTSGPCVECLEEGTLVTEQGAEAIASRWPQVGQAIVDAGFDSVASYPLVWRGQPIGGLNVFGRVAEQDAERYVEERHVLGQAFAGLMTLALATSEPGTLAHVTVALHEALIARSVVEQAKGVLAYREGLDMEDAYVALLDRASDSGTTITATAQRVVEAEQRDRCG